MCLIYIFKSLLFISIIFVLMLPCHGNTVKQTSRKHSNITLKQRLIKLEELVKKQQKLINVLIQQKNTNNEQVLQKRIDELEQKIETLTSIQKEDSLKKITGANNNSNNNNQEPLIDTTQQQTITTTGGEKQLPDISVVANASTHISDDRSDTDRNRLLLNESEISMQGYLYPTIRGDLFYSFGRKSGGNELNGELEEGYTTFLETPLKNVSVKAGKMRIDFGKTNKLHPHSLPYEDTPSVLKNFLGNDGLKGHGIEASYLLPTSRDFFAQLQAGWWRPDSLRLDPETGLEYNNAGSRFADRLFTGRLWLSKEVSEDSELELGLSSAWGRSIFNGSGDDSYDPIQLYGADITYRKFPGIYKKLTLQAEWMLHRRKMIDTSLSRSGYYLLGTYQFNKFWEWGLRYDNASLPAPSSGHESSISTFLTNNFSESTFMRYQFKHGKHFEGNNFNEFIIQFVWGIGPHSHSLK